MGYGGASFGPGGDGGEEVGNRRLEEEGDAGEKGRRGKTLGGLPAAPGTGGDAKSEGGNKALFYTKDMLDNRETVEGPVRVEAPGRNGETGPAGR